ncbi:MAG: hypothetical protein JOZ05_23335 [Acetobacteraceae bacterium]|nr:hypothetical protein [Acetobacteraceae bacterium]
MELKSSDFRILLTNEEMVREQAKRGPLGAAVDGAEQGHGVADFDRGPHGAVGHACISGVKRIP